MLFLLIILSGCIGKKTEQSNKTKTVDTVKNEKVKPLISASELLSIRQNKNLILVDTRMGKDIKNTYQQNHLDEAFHVDLNADLSDIKEDAANGGRHPLPSLEQFSNVLMAIGITSESHVVVYDDKNGSIASARLWWMLKSIGHENVQVLNGGMKEAEKIGFPMSSHIETPNKVAPYKIDSWKLPMMRIDEVEKVSEDKEYLVIDVRAEERYKGKTEPIDLVAGHIPGAINIPFSTNLDENGLYLPPAKLKETYQKILGTRPTENVTVHCGSGVTACHTLLAMAHAELGIPNLYVGSWSEWSRNNKPIATSLNK